MVAIGFSRRSIFRGALLSFLGGASAQAQGDVAAPAVPSTQGKSLRDYINIVFRDHRRYSGDGMPGEPLGAPLPIGDPQSGPNTPSNAYLRQYLGEWSDGVDRAREIATNAANLAQQYAANAAQISGVDVPIFESRATAASLAIKASVKLIRINYYAPTYTKNSTLVGGAQYRRISRADLAPYPAASYFRSKDRALPDGTVDPVAGGYWVLAEWLANITQFGAVGDATGEPGVGTDSTVAIHAAIDWCKLTGSPVRVPAGQFRVTSGYTHNAAFQEISFVGEGEVTRNNLGLNPGSAIILDNSSPSSFFYRATGSSGIRVIGMTFGCAQEIKDRKFFRFSERDGIKQVFRDVLFVQVEKPIVYESGSYFQWSSFENVSFRNSGTIHSEVEGLQGSVSTLVGTGMTMINVTHDGGIPDATDKVVMNLQGIREINSFNLLLEGFLPSDGWIILKCNCKYNNNWARIRVGTFVGTHIEWSGRPNNITYLCDLGSGRFQFEGAYFIPVAQQRIRLSGYAELQIDGGVSSANEVANDMFEFGGINNHVIFKNSTLRVFRPSDNRFSIQNCTLGTFDNQPRQGNTASSLVAKWDGGYLDGSLLSLTKSRAVVCFPSIDPVYGRKLVAIPFEDTLDLAFATPAARFSAGDQVTAVARLKLPVYAAGQILVRLRQNSHDLMSIAYGAGYSGQIVDIHLSGKVSGAAAGGVYLIIGNLSAVNLSAAAEIYSLAFYAGENVPRSEHASHPRNIVTWNSAAPASGEWARGDVVNNTAPSAGGAPGWVCVAGGSPGTWKAMSNLSA